MNYLITEVIISLFNFISIISMGGCSWIHRLVYTEGGRFQSTSLVNKTIIFSHVCCSILGKVSIKLLLQQMLWASLLRMILNEYVVWREIMKMMTVWWGGLCEIWTWTWHCTGDWKLFHWSPWEAEQGFYLIWTQLGHDNDIHSCPHLTLTHQISRSKCRFLREVELFYLDVCQIFLVKVFNSIK